jgi:hypothetical protein
MNVELPEYSRRMNRAFRRHPVTISRQHGDASLHRTRSLVRDFGAAKTLRLPSRRLRGDPRATLSRFAGGRSRSRSKQSKRDPVMANVESKLRKARRQETQRRKRELKQQRREARQGSKSGGRGNG